MYSFSQLLLKNIVLALIFVTSICAVSFSMLSSLVDEKTNQHNKTITLFAQQLPFIDDEQKRAANFANKLQQISPYDNLTIYNTAGKKLFHYKNSNATLAIPLLFPEAKKVTACAISSG